MPCFQALRGTKRAAGLLIATCVGLMACGFTKSLDGYAEGSEQATGGSSADASAGHSGTGGTKDGGVDGGGGSGGKGSGGSGGHGGTSGGAGSAGKGGSAGSTGGSGGSVGGSGGSSGSTGEDCLNNIDDNQDGLFDCDDPLCQADYMCAPEFPAGWEAVGWSAEGAVSCGGLFEQQVGLYQNSELSVPAAQCSCGCGTLTGGDCRIMGELFVDTNCGGSSVNVSTVNSDGCTLSYVNGIQSVAVSPPQAVGVSCPANNQQVIASVDWSPTRTGCYRQHNGACIGTSKPCIPRLSGAEGPCIQRAGNVSCPANYPRSAVYFDGQVVDTRGCDFSACACSPNASCLEGSITFYSDTSCNSSVFGSGTSGNCINTPLSDVAAYEFVGAAPTGTCASSGAAIATGTATPNTTVTVCCVN